ncbi:MAG: RNA pyrophosphohydrolase [Oligoflexus sp.]
MKPYRPCVVAAIVRSDGHLLVGERSNQPGAWQLPQGGIDEGESPEQAVLRELREEIGTNSVTILSRGLQTICYEFPPEMITKISAQYRGQEQWWFSLQLHSQARPDLALSDGEFVNLDWRSPREVLENIISWKKIAYERGLRQLGLLGEHL